MIPAITAIEALGLPVPVAGKTTTSASPAPASFAELVRSGINATDAKLAQADRLVAAFAVDETIPAHKVTFALEEARLSLELMLQVRNRLVEGYQQIMNMQV